VGYEHESEGEKYTGKQNLLACGLVAYLIYRSWFFLLNVSLNISCVFHVSIMTDVKLAIKQKSKQKRHKNELPTFS